MKKLLLALLGICCGASLFAAVGSTTPQGWYDDFAEAQKEAVKTGRPILALFTGSDWCPGCIALNEYALSKPEFMEFAKKNLVLLYMDSPRYAKQSAKERATVDKVNRKLDPGPYIPATVLVSSDGRILERMVGAFPAKEYIKKIQSAIK